MRMVKFEKVQVDNEVLSGVTVQVDNEVLSGVTVQVDNEVLSRSIMKYYLV